MCTYRLPKSWDLKFKSGCCVIANSSPDRSSGLWRYVNWVSVVIQRDVTLMLIMTDSGTVHRGPNVLSLLTSTDLIFSFILFKVWRLGRRPIVGSTVSSLVYLHHSTFLVFYLGYDAQSDSLSQVQRSVTWNVVVS